MGKMRTFMLGGVGGAIAAYLFDPDRGRGRRVKAVDRARGVTRRAERRVERLRRRTAAGAYGLSKKIEFAGTDSGPDADDPVTLADKVRSEALGGRSVPKGRISVSTEDGVVILRGMCDTVEEIRSVERAVKRVAGVTGVRNLLHLAGTPAPNKAEAIRAGAGDGERV